MKMDQDKPNYLTPPFRPNRLETEGGVKYLGQILGHGPNCWKPPGDRNIMDFGPISPLKSIFFSGALRAPASSIYKGISPVKCRFFRARFARPYCLFTKGIGARSAPEKNTDFRCVIWRNPFGRRYFEYQFLKFDPSTT